MGRDVLVHVLGVNVAPQKINLVVGVEVDEGNGLVVPCLAC